MFPSNRCRGSRGSWCANHERRHVDSSGSPISRADAAIEHPELRVGHHERQAPEQTDDGDGSQEEGVEFGGRRGGTAGLNSRSSSGNALCVRATSRIPETMRWWMAGRRKNACRTTRRPMAQAKMRHSSLNDTRTPAGCSTKPPFTQTVRARNNSTTDRTSTAVTR